MYSINPNLYDRGLKTDPLYANGIAYIDAFACIFQKPGVLISFKDHDIIAVLVGRQQEIAGRIEIEIARRFSHCILMPFQC